MHGGESKIKIPGIAILDLRPAKNHPTPPGSALRKKRIRQRSLPEKKDRDAVPGSPLTLQPGGHELSVFD